MESKLLKVGCGQFTVSSNIAHNWLVIRKLLHKSVALGVKVLFLPEASDYLAQNASHSYRLSQQTERLLIEPLRREISSIYMEATRARASASEETSEGSGSDESSGLFVSIGIHAPDPLGKTINKLLWIDNKGQIVHSYDKLHLFDVNIKNGPILKESNSVIKGEKILPPFPVSEYYHQFKVGFSICYDIRFPELSLKLFKLGANILTFPSAFTVKTGKSHWKVLGQTRAIDNQSYVIMAAQCGQHQIVDETSDEGSDKVRISYGNSLIIDPWGDILAEGKRFDEDLEEDEEGDYYELIEGELNLDVLMGYRENMPLLEHRRGDIFP